MAFPQCFFIKWLANLNELKKTRNEELDDIGIEGDTPKRIITTSLGVESFTPKRTNDLMHIYDER